MLPPRGEPNDPPFSQLELARDVDASLGRILRADHKYLLNLATVEVSNTGGDPNAARSILDEAKPLLPGGRSSDQFLWLWIYVRADTLGGDLASAQQKLGELKDREDDPTPDERIWTDLLAQRGDIPWMYKEIVRVANQREFERKRLGRVLDTALDESVQTIGSSPPSAMAADSSVISSPVGPPPIAAAAGTLPTNRLPGTSADQRDPKAVAVIAPSASKWWILLGSVFGACTVGLVIFSRRHRKLYVLMFVGIGLASASAKAATAPLEDTEKLTAVGDLLFTPVINFGTVPEGAVMTGSMLVRNTSAEERTLLMVKKECGCTAVAPSVTIAPRSSQSISLSLSTGGKEHGIVSTGVLFADSKIPKNLYLVRLSARVEDPILTPIRVRTEESVPDRIISVPVTLHDPANWRIKSAVGGTVASSASEAQILIGHLDERGFNAELLTPEIVGNYVGFYEATVVSTAGENLIIAGRFSGTVQDPVFAEQGEIAIGVYSRKERKAITREIVVSAPSINLADFEFPKSIQAEIIRPSHGAGLRLKITYLPPEDVQPVGPVTMGVRIRTGSDHIVVPITAFISE
jgi:hypothetical protein